MITPAHMFQLPTGQVLFARGCFFDAPVRVSALDALDVRTHWGDRRFSSREIALIDDAHGSDGVLISGVIVVHDAAGYLADDAPPAAWRPITAQETWPELVDTLDFSALL